MQQQLRDKDSALERARANHMIELSECHAKLQKKENEIKQITANHHDELQKKSNGYELQIEQLQKENRELKKQIESKVEEAASAQVRF